MQIITPFLDIQEITICILDYYKDKIIEPQKFKLLFGALSLTYKTLFRTELIHLVIIVYYFSVNNFLIIGGYFS